MSMRYPGGLIAPTPVNQQYPSGVWTGPQSAPYQANNVWGNDSSFKNTTLLLHGDGATRSFTQDASTNNFQITLNGDTKPNNLTPFISNGYWSNYFDGSGDYLQVSHNTALDLGSGDFTVEFWLNTPSWSSGTAGLVGKKLSDSTNGWQIYRDSGQPTKLNGRLGQQNNFFTTSSVTTNVWEHWALVRTGTTLYWFKNGVLDATGSSSLNITDATASLNIAYGDTWSAYGNFHLSNLRVVKGTAVYTTNFTPSTTPLTAITNTSLLTCQSNRFVDNSANNFTITRNGDASVSMQQPFTAPSGTSLFGSGYFDGSGDSLTLANNAAFNFGANNFTIEAWVYVTATPGGSGAVIVGKNSATYPGGYEFNFVVDTGRTVFFGAYTTTLVSLQGAIVTSLNSWNHVAAVRSGSNWALFVNGVRDVTATSSGTIQTTSSSVYVGDYGGGSRNLTGYISNVRLVNGSAVYDPTVSTLTVPTSPLATITNTQLLTLQTNGPATNNAFLDSSYNSFPVTRNGNTTQGAFSPYGSNWSNYFGGAGNYMTTPSGSASTIVGTINSSLNLCIECWVYLNEYSGSSTFPALIGNMDPTTQSDDWSFGPVSTGALMFYWFDGSQKRAYTTSTIPLGAWTHTAVNISAGVITLFINGVSQTLTGNTTLTTALVGRNYLTLGQWNNGSGSDFGFFKGYVSNLRVIKASTYTANFTPSTAPLTAVTNTSLLICQSNRFVDNSANAFALTASGSPSVQRFSPFVPTVQYTPSTLGGSGYFDGSGDYLTVANNAAFNLSSGNWTIEAWVYRTASSQMILFSKDHYSGVYYPQYQISINASSFLELNLGTGGTTPSTAYTGSTAIPLNQWAHICAVKSGANTLGFVNGVQQWNTTAASMADTGLPLYVCGIYNAGALGTGYITDARIVKGTAVYTSAFTPPTVPLTAIANTSLLLPYNGAAIFDNSGMNNLETVGDAKVSTAITKYGTGSMYFDGSGDYLLAKSNDVFNFGTGDFTVEFWINASASGSYTQTIGTLVSGTEAGTWRIGNRFNSLNQIYFARGTGSGFNEFQANVNVNDGAWHHVAVVRYSGTVTIYADGIASGSSSITGTCTSSNPLYLGYNGRDNAYITGYLDDVRITKGVARYVGNFTPPVARMPNQ